MRVLTTSVLSLAAFASVSATTAVAEGEKRVDYGTTGCKTVVEHKRQWMAFKAEDRQAFDAIFSENLSSGKCKSLPEGVVTVENKTPPGDDPIQYCVRPQFFDECWWVMRMEVKTVEAEDQ